jgi:hypothetical protein
MFQFEDLRGRVGFAKALAVSRGGERTCHVPPTRSRECQVLIENSSYYSWREKPLSGPAEHWEPKVRVLLA